MNLMSMFLVFVGDSWFFDYAIPKSKSFEA